MHGRSSLAALILLTAAAQAQDGAKALLDQFDSLPKPAQQSDLDTFALASAHRERAESIRQRTDGLWQSWLVSICAGCGEDRRSVTDREGAEDLRTLRIGQPERGPARPRFTYYVPADGRVPRPDNISADLSNENIDQIRRDPNR
jgi:hypothetical protein